MPQPSVPVVGAAVPDFPLVDARGRASTLAAARNGRRAIVYFMRSNTCPVCLAHAAAIQRMLDAGEVADAAFLLILPGEAHEAIVTERRVRASGGSSAEVWASGNGHGEVGLGRFLGLQHSGTLVVDERGVLLAIRVRALPTGNFSRNEVVAALTRATDASAEPQPGGLRS